MELFDNEAAHSGDETDAGSDAGSAEGSEAAFSDGDGFIVDTDEEEELESADEHERAKGRRSGRGLVRIEDSDEEDSDEEQQHRSAADEDATPRAAARMPHFTPSVCGAHVVLSGKRVRMRLS